MTRRSALIALIATAVCALGGATAQAADQWYTGTTAPLTTLAVGTSKPIKGKSGGSVLTTPGLGISTVCSANSFTGKITNVSTSGIVEAHIGITSGLKSTGCVIKTHPGGASTTCTVNSPGQKAGTIVTTPLTAKITTNTAAHKAHLLLAPANGTVYSEIEIGGGCALETGEPTPVTSNLEGALISPVEATTESHIATVEFPSTALSGSAIKMGLFPGTYISTEEIELETAGEKAKIE